MQLSCLTWWGETFKVSICYGSSSLRRNHFMAVNSDVSIFPGQSSKLLPGRTHIEMKDVADQDDSDIRGGSAFKN